MRIPFRRDDALESADPKKIASVFGDVRGVSVLSLCSVLADIEENMGGVPERFVHYQQRALKLFGSKTRSYFEANKSQIEAKDGLAEELFMKFCLCSRWSKVVEVYLNLQSSLDQDIPESVPAAAPRSTKHSTGIELFTVKMAMDDIIASIITCVSSNASSIHSFLFNFSLISSLFFLLQGIEKRRRSLQRGDLAELQNGRGAGS